MCYLKTLMGGCKEHSFCAVAIPLLVMAVLTLRSRAERKCNLVHLLGTGDRTLVPLNLLAIQEFQNGSRSFICAFVSN
jgi:hypothetical protein